MRNIVGFIFFLIPLTGLQAQITQFDNWHTYSVGGVNLQIPNGWSGVDSTIVFYGFSLNPGATFVAQVEQETPGYGGTGSAIKVVTKNQSALTGAIPAGPFPSLASNANIVVNTTDLTIELQGGWSYNTDPVSVSMWVKNQVVGSDSTGIVVYAIDNSDGGDSIAGIADTLLGANINTWTKITLPFTYRPGFSTQLLKVMLSSSGNYTQDSLTGEFLNLNAGTWLMVDNLEIAAPAGITTRIYNRQIATLFPTPAWDELNIDCSKLQFEGTGVFEVFGLKGDLLKRIELQESINKLPLMQWPSGMFTYRISDSKGLIQTGQFTSQSK